MRIISGDYKGRTLQYPPSKITRPTSDRARESIFNILLHLDDFTFNGAVVLDLFAGSGAMGLEALSRGAISATFLDLSPIACQVITSNIQFLKVNNKTCVLSVDALGLPLALTPANLVFVDPPYFHGFETPVLSELVVKGWVKSGTIVVIETSKKTKLEVNQSVFLPLTTRTFSNTAISIFKVINDINSDHS